MHIYKEREGVFALEKNLFALTKGRASALDVLKRRAGRRMARELETGSGLLILRRPGLRYSCGRVCV